MSDSFISRQKRNQCLIRFLKPKLKQTRWKCVKKDIKTMLAIARNPNGNLERRLYLLNDETHSDDLNNSQRLYKLLGQLEDSGFPSLLYNAEQPIKPDTIYLLDDHLEHCFEGQRQVAPISLLIQSKRSSDLKEIIDSLGYFKSELLEWNNETQQAHLALHPA